MTRIDLDVKALEQTRQRTRGDDADATRAKITRQIEELSAERKALEAQIPESWTPEHDAFVKIQKADVDARRLYRRTVDEAYAPVQETTKVLGGHQGYLALEEKIRSLESVLASKPPQEAAEVVQEVVREIRGVAGTRQLASAVNAVRRELRRRSVDIDKAKAALTKALADYTEEKAWRSAAQANVLPALRAYEEKIRPTIGLRQQPRLPREQALYVAGCSSDHRDISLSF